MQVPSNIFLNYIGRPSLYLPACMVVWGIIRYVAFVPHIRRDLNVHSAVTGLTRNFTGALLVRLFLGFVEGTFFPGALFLLSKWYISSYSHINMTKRLTIGTLAKNLVSGMQSSTVEVSVRMPLVV